MENGFNVLIDCRDGKFIVNKNDNNVGRSMINYGEYSPGEMQLFKQICAPGDVIIEVGANIGAHTVGLAKMVGSEGRVIAIEPQPIVFYTLCGNLSLNSITNCSSLNLGVSNAEGKIRIPYYDYSKERNWSAIDLLTEYDTGQEVQVKRLDDIFLEARMPRLKLLKIDAEGMEKEILEGGGEIIRNFKPIISVENDKVDKSKALIEHLFGLDYVMWWHVSKLYAEDNFNKNPENVFGNMASFNMLCIHKSVETDINLPKVENSDYHPVEK